jgi:hypothetical protein
VKSVPLWSAKKKKLIKRPSRATVPQLIRPQHKNRLTVKRESSAGSAAMSPSRSKIFGTPTKNTSYLSTVFFTTKRFVRTESCGKFVSLHIYLSLSIFTYSLLGIIFPLLVKKGKSKNFSQNSYKKYPCKLCGKT